MDRQWKWRTLGVIGLVVLSVLMLVPTVVGVSAGVDEEEVALPEWFTAVFSQRMVLGLDLQGGIHLQYKVDVEEALRRKTKLAALSLAQLIFEEAKVKVTVEPGEGTELDELTTLKVTFPTEGDVDKLTPDIVRKQSLDYDIGDTDGNVVSIVMRDQAITDFTEQAVDKSIETIERRINAFGVAESSITKRGDGQLVVELPGLKEADFAAAKQKLSQTGQLRFQIVDRGAQGAFFAKIAGRAPAADAWPEGLDPELKPHKLVANGSLVRSTSKEILEYMVDGQLDAEHMVGFEEIYVKPSDASLAPIGNLSKEQEQAARKANGDLDASIVKAYEINYLFSVHGMSGENVEDASIGYDEFNRPVVHMSFGLVDKDKFCDMTKQFTKELMAIMIDDVVYSAPSIREPICGGRVQIELGSVGQSAQKEGEALVAVLKSGALAAPLRKLYDSQVGPTLGADSVAAGRLSVLVGLALVIGFMVVYYKFAGMVANLALLLNLLFVMAGLTAFGATLTLPGIAGIVLTVGMAVDANVLIFERIREELRQGVSVRKAIDAGYEKAFSAILDANVTTGIAAIVLYQFGSGPVRGFAVTLFIGIICSMYTALSVTRLVFTYLYGRGGEPERMSI